MPVVLTCHPWEASDVFVTSIISSQEWIRLRGGAAKQFPNEELARGEIMRRYAMSGVAVLKNLSEQDRARLQHEHQSTMQSRARKATAADNFGLTCQASEVAKCTGKWR